MRLKRLAAIFGPPLVVLAGIAVYQALAYRYADVAKPRPLRERLYGSYTLLGVKDPATFAPPEAPFSEYHLGEYIIKLYAHTLTNDNGACEVTKGRQRVFAAVSGYDFEFCDTAAEDADEDSDNGGPSHATAWDMNGLGQLNVVLRGVSGGHSDTYYLLQLGEEFRVMEVMDLCTASFKDLDGDSRTEVTTLDNTFEGWGECNARSPAPEVVLRFAGGGCILATDLMQKPAPSDAELRKTAAKVAADSSWGTYDYGWTRDNILESIRRMDPCHAWDYDRIPSDLWREMLDLIYAGHEDKAWEFFDMAWKPRFRGKERFRRHFTGMLHSSPFWPDIEEMNRKTSSAAER